MPGFQSMDVIHQLSINRLTKVVRKRTFWLIVALLVLITLPHYGEVLQHPAFLTQLASSLGLTRHAFERVLYLVPIVWAGYLFGLRGAIVTSLTALACMVPRAVLISPSLLDATLETSAVFISGNVLAIGFDALRKERGHRIQLGVTQQELQASEERYRELFESAHDAIYLHDLEGNIIAANRACARLTGYSLKELYKLNTDDLLSKESLDVAASIKRLLLTGEASGSIAEVKLNRKDGSETLIQLSASLVYTNGKPVAIQHMARDITEERRLQDNLRVYLQKITRAQEEERKRISRELHDETLQSLIILSRQLDTFASRSKELSQGNSLCSLFFEELRQHTTNIIDGVRRLSQDLRPAALDRLGLLPALEWLASEVEEHTGTETRVKVIGTKRRLAEEVELVLFHIAQEALRNVGRHAQATQAEVLVEFNGRKTRVTVSDNGKGFIPPKTIGDLARDGKLGLTGMLERAQLLGGTLTIQSEPGKGSSITVEIPA